jgi:hypothetical protein
MIFLGAGSLTCDEEFRVSTCWERRAGWRDLAALRGSWLRQWILLELVYPVSLAQGGDREHCRSLWGHNPDCSIIEEAPLARHAR